MKRVYRVLYRIGFMPWDSARIPGPLAAEIRASAPGIAVDLGCGTGRHARHLAANGWSVTAVDFVPRALAIATAADRATPAGQAPAGAVTWRLADVTKAAEVDPGGRLARSVSLILDNGCLHGLSGPGNPDAGRKGWARTVQHLAAPGCVLLLRAASSTGSRRGSPGLVGVGPREVTELLGARWHPAGTPAPGWTRFALGAAGI